ncbi:MAG: prephenate dehydrogenase [Candidatus Omnitrophota bacterium]|jgi:prephenate dehydrogenase
MKPFNTIAIVGTGLIGGSLALDIKKHKLAQTILGLSRSAHTIATAKRKGIIDKGSQDITLLKDADFIILATPVKTILALAPAIAREIKPTCIVIDVGSTKEKIVVRLSKLFPRFVGCHPLAGSEKRGIENASGNLFMNSVCIITPLTSTDKKALGRVTAFWRTLGARIFFISPQKHDLALSFISHFPHIIAFALINAVPSQYLPIAPNSLRDTTRVASSEPELWADIFLTNRVNLEKTIKIFQENLALFQSAIRRNDKRKLIALLEKAKNKRGILK